MAEELSIIRILQHLSKVIGEGFRDELRFAAANTGLWRGFESQELSLIKAAGSKQIPRKTAEAINMGISQARVPEFLWSSGKGGFVGSTVGRYYRDTSGQ